MTKVFYVPLEPDGTFKVPVSGTIISYDLVPDRDLSNTRLLRVIIDEYRGNIRDNLKAPSQVSGDVPLPDIQRTVEQRLLQQKQS